MLKTASKGIEIDTEGTENLIIWVPYSSESKTTIKITSNCG
jgi:hypothetical protein